jgi:uncharacterized RDD family membrane protein YckC
MTDLTKDILTDIEAGQIKYSTFWQRFFASLLDGLILIPFVVIDTFNKTSWKSYLILILSFIITLAYKPFFEMKYGATLGKMALNLRIVNRNYQRADSKNIVLRNIFDITDRILIGIITVIIFATPSFQDIDSLAKYSNLSNSEMGANWITIGMGIIVLIDSIVLIADSRRQSLHDRIGQTFVIRK